jgi:hypothetical protein
MILTIAKDGRERFFIRQHSCCHQKSSISNNEAESRVSPNLLNSKQETNLKKQTGRKRERECHRDKGAEIREKQGEKNREKNDQERKKLT